MKWNKTLKSASKINLTGASVLISVDGYRRIIISEERYNFWN